MGHKASGLSVFSEWSQSNNTHTHTHKVIFGICEKMQKCGKVPKFDEETLCNCTANRLGSTGLGLKDNN